MYDSDSNAIQKHSLRYPFKLQGLNEIADGGGHALEKLGEAVCRETKHGAKNIIFALCCKSVSVQ